MSVRRLAGPAVQPAAFAFNRAKSAEAKVWIRKYPKGREQSAVIPLLMLAQEQDGWVTKAAIEHVADMLGMPYIRALEVATFYTQFQLKPVGTRAHVQVCGTTPCMLRGSEALMDVCRSKIHAEQFHTNAAGTLSWEEVECLGACVNAPMVMVFKDTYEDLTPERLAEIIDAFGSGKGASVAPGPQIGRVYSAPESGLTSLKDEKAVLKSTRDRESKAAALPSSAPPTASVPPTQSAKPKTDAPETDPKLKSPSKAKAAPAVEQARSIAPKHSERSANLAEPAVEEAIKQRNGPKARSEPVAAFKAPEGGGKSVAAKPKATGKPADGMNPTAKLAETAHQMKAAPAPRTRATREPVNPTLALAKTAKGQRKPEPAPVAALADVNRPVAIERPAKIDDLKLISGVGPKIEGILHSLGIYTFAQVAAWKKAEREWVDTYLKFHGRIERDDWIRQAKALAKGGVAEYVRVFGRKPV